MVSIDNYLFFVVVETEEKYSLSLNCRVAHVNPEPFTYVILFSEECGSVITVVGIYAIGGSLECLCVPIIENSKFTVQITNIFKWAC
jgi:hypothetical protein